MWVGSTKGGGRSSAARGGAMDGGRELVGARPEGATRGEERRRGYGRVPHLLANIRVPFLSTGAQQARKPAVARSSGRRRLAARVQEAAAAALGFRGGRGALGTAFIGPGNLGMCAGKGSGGGGSRTMRAEVGDAADVRAPPVGGKARVPGGAGLRLLLRCWAGCWAKAQGRLREERGKDGPREWWPAQGGEKKLFSFYKD